MRFQDRRKVHLLYLIIDIIIICTVFYLVCNYNPKRVPQNFLQFRLYLFVFSFWGLALIFLLNNFHLYSTDRSLSIPKEWWQVIKCVLFSSVLTGLFIFVLKIDIFSRLVFIESTLLLGIKLSLWRTIKRILIRHYIKKGYINLNILIIGAGKAGFALVEEIQNNPYLGLKIVGFLDDNKTGQINGVKILGKTKDLEEIVKKYFIDEIYITIPSERKLVSDLLQKGIKLKKTVRVLAERFELPYYQIGLNYIGSVALITYFEKGLHGSEKLIKRLFDLLGATILLFLLSPLFLVIAFLIKLESKGPVFYISKRSGKKGKIFNFYKFRSMFNNADEYKKFILHKSETKGPIFKMKSDPRVTRLGRFLRRYSLDELPQLINVLKGDMSLVGPRPFPVEETHNIEYNYLSRLDVKPGITGLAQVKGRSDLSFRKWVKYDLWYIDNWSLGLDLKILLWTIPAVIKARGAY